MPMPTLRLDLDAQYTAPGALVSLLQIVGEASLLAEGLQGSYLVNLRLTDDAGMQSLNRQMRGIDAPTDVLSFPSVSYPPGKTARQLASRLRKEWDPEAHAAFLGDIVISWPQAEAQAAAFGHPVLREAGYLFAHGLFHLMGYDHETQADKARMRAKEEQAVQRTGLLREGPTDELLLQMAFQARGFAYAPYSGYAVGACLLCKDGRLFTGCNVENAAYGMSLCAERTALCKAVSEGARDFEAIAVVAEGPPPFPCGACRQMLYEFAPGMRVLVSDGAERWTATLDELLPHGFGGAAQERDRTS